MDMVDKILLKGGKTKTFHRRCNGYCIDFSITKNIPGTILDLDVSSSCLCLAIFNGLNLLLPGASVSCLIALIYFLPKTYNKKYCDSTLAFEHHQWLTPISQSIQSPPEIYW